MLEWGARFAGEAENGALLHVAGITYKINTTIPDTTQANEIDVWIGGPAGDYRVYDVTVYNKNTNAFEPLDLNAKYNLAGYNYTLRDLGGGFDMLTGSVNVLDYVMEDYMVLANYVQGFENGVIEAENSPLLAKYPNMLINYSNLKGSGRLQVVTELSKEDQPQQGGEGQTPVEPQPSQKEETKPTDNPQTGDNSLIFVWTALMFVSGSGVLVFHKKKVK